MRKMFRKWEIVVEEVARQGEEYILTLLTMDALAMVFTVGVVTIFSAIVETLIGVPNWPELILAFLLVYTVCFNVIIEAMAYVLCAEELGCNNHFMVEDYMKQRFKEEI